MLRVMSPLDRLLWKSDSPLPLRQHRTRKENQPAMVRDVAEYGCAGKGATLKNWR